MGSLSRLPRLIWGPLAIGLPTVRRLHQRVFEALRGCPFAQGFFPTFRLLEWGGRGEAGATRLLKKRFWVFCLHSAGGGGEQGWVVLLSACRCVARTSQRAVIATLFITYRSIYYLLYKTPNKKTCMSVCMYVALTSTSLFPSPLYINNDRSLISATAIDWSSQSKIRVC